MKGWKLQMPALAFFVLGSCTYESEMIPDNPINCSEITYAQNVEPIIEANCAVSSCHIPGTGLPNFRVFSTVQALAQEIKFRTGTRDMPRGGGTLSNDEINTIACWVDAGAPDN